MNGEVVIEKCILYALLDFLIRHFMARTIQFIVFVFFSCLSSLKKTNFSLKSTKEPSAWVALEGGHLQAAGNIPKVQMELRPRAVPVLNIREWRRL